MKRLFLDGTAIEVSGSGPPVVLLHGVGLDQTVWAYQVEALAASHQVITYDLLGHGRSAPVPVDARLADWRRQLESVIQHLAIEKFSLVGFSFGGLIAQAYAARHAKMIDKFVLMSTVYGRNETERASVLARLEIARREGPSAIIPAALSRWFSPAFAGANPDIMQKYEAMLRSNDAASFLSAYRCFATADEELGGALSGYPGPALVITGELDMGSTPAMAQKLAGTIPGAECIIVREGRHMLPVERAGEVNSILQQFLYGSLA